MLIIMRWRLWLHIYSLCSFRHTQTTSTTDQIRIRENRRRKEKANILKRREIEKKSPCLKIHLKFFLFLFIFFYWHTNQHSHLLVVTIYFFRFFFFRFRLGYQKLYYSGNFNYMCFGTGWVYGSLFCPDLLVSIQIKASCLRPSNAVSPKIERNIANLVFESQLSAVAILSAIDNSAKEECALNIKMTQCG